MNFWINNTPDELRNAFEFVDGLVINEAEARSLSGEVNLVVAGEKMMLPHFKLLVLKKGSSGVMVFGKGFIISLPAYPIQTVVDPTGAGDSYAGAFISYLDANNVDPADREAVKKAAIYATIVASFAVEGFGVEGIDRTTPEMIRERHWSLIGFLITRFE
jgi:sugar/nucleoside kinase (ribokinase family)